MLQAFRKLVENDELTLWEFSRALWIYSRFKSNALDISAEEEVSEATMRVILYFWGYAELSLGKFRTDISLADYGRHNDTLVCNELNIKPQDLLFSHWGYRMGHFVVKRHHFLVWVFRPTLSPQDVSIDLDFESKPFLDGYAHGGMLQEAQTLFGRVWGIIKNHLDDESEIILTGHSLGGSMAAIMCCILRHGHPEISSYAFCFGAVPCLSRGISERFHPFMLGICVGDDVVVRLSYEGFVDLKKRLFLISKLNADETVLQEQGHIHGHTWAHQKDLCTPERLWPPWKQIYVRREPERGLCVTKVNATDFVCPVVSMRCLLDHAPITYDEILWEYMR